MFGLCCETKQHLPAEIASFASGWVSQDFVQSCVVAAPKKCVQEPRHAQMNPKAEAMLCFQHVSDTAFAPFFIVNDLRHPVVSRCLQTQSQSTH